MHRRLKNNREVWGGNQVNVFSQNLKKNILRSNQPYKKVKVSSIRISNY